MIGRKISDQTITCKVIKPMQVTLNGNQSVTTQNAESPSKPGPRMVNVNYEHQTIGRVFGMSNNSVEVEVDIGLNYQNQFNRLNHFSKESQFKNTVKSTKQATGNDKETVMRKQKEIKETTSRNVTHFFINNKEKPINVEPVKKVTKKALQTPKTQDVSLKVNTKDQNKTQFFEDPFDKTQNKRVIQNTKVFQAVKQKNTPNNHAKAHNTMQMPKQGQNSHSSKEIPKMNKNGAHCSSKQRLSMFENSSKVHEPRKDRSMKKQEKSVKRQEKSVKKVNERLKSNTSYLDKKEIDISLKPWNETSEDPSICIQNYVPNMNVEQKNQEFLKQDTKIKQQRMEIKEHEGLTNNFSHQVTKKAQIQVPKVTVSKVPFKKYMSVKEQIQEKLKQKKIKQNQLEQKRREFEHQKRLEQEEKKHIQGEEATGNQIDIQYEYENQEQEQYEEQRLDIPEPIQAPFVQQLLQKNQQTAKTNKVDLEDVEIGSHSQFIYNEIMSHNQEKQEEHEKNPQAQPISNFPLKQPPIPNKVLYNYVESSDQSEQHEGLYEETQMPQLKGTSQMLAFELQHEDGELQNSNFDQYKEFQEDLQNQISTKNAVKSQYLHHQQNTQTFEDQEYDEKPSIKTHFLSEMSKQQISKNQATELLPKPLSKPIPQKPSKPVESQDESDQEEEQETNPKLQQYLKNRNLISSKPSKQTSLTSKQSKLKISQILNQKSYPNIRKPEVIIELEEEYLQSSIIVNNPQTENKIQNKIPITTYEKNYQQQISQNDMDVDLNPPHMQFFNQLNHKIEIQDSSSDSQENVTQYQPLKNPPFVNPANVNTNGQLSIDQLFDLNLDTLLNKEFIRLN